MLHLNAPTGECRVGSGAPLKVLSVAGSVHCRLVVLSSGEWVLPYWRDNLVWAATKWPESLSHCRTKVRERSDLSLSCGASARFQMSN